MALLTFKGGIHPDDGKSLAKDKAIVEIKPKGNLVYPLSQHIGAPASPVVAVGDHVLKGQRSRRPADLYLPPSMRLSQGQSKRSNPISTPQGQK